MDVPAGPGAAVDEPADGALPDFGGAVIDLVRAIPPGRVMTYGSVAAALGSRAARQVGKVMAHEGSDVPWWRVVRSGGHPPVRLAARALEMYRAEGTPLVRRAAAWRVDLRRAHWSPDLDGAGGARS